LTSRASVGFVALAGTELTTNQGFQSLIPSESVDGVFLMFWIQMNRSEFESRSAGSTFKEISKSNVKSIAINLPPLVEQKRIVDLVSSADAYIDALQQQVDSARTARNAVLHELLSAGGDDWTETTLGEIITLEYGKPLKAENRDGKGFPVFGSAGEVGLHSEPLVNEAPVIVVGRKGTAGAVWWSDLPCSVIDTAYYVVQKVETDIRFLYFILGYLDLPSLTAQTGVPGLNRDRAYSSRVLLPLLDEQKRIVEILSSMDDVIQSTEQAVVEAKNLRSGLLSDLLSGEHEIPASYDSLLGAA
jgi:type I restriction enzyme S subunit